MRLPPIIMLLLLSRSARSDECRKSKNARPPLLPRLLFLPKLALVVGLQKPPRLILLILLLLLELLPRWPLPEALLLMCLPELPLAELLSRGIRPMPPPLLLLLLRPFMRKG